jgi:hypothetical protein
MASYERIILAVNKYAVKKNPEIIIPIDNGTRRYSLRVVIGNLPLKYPIEPRVPHKKTNSAKIFSPRFGL